MTPLPAQRWVWRFLVLEAMAWLVLAALALRLVPFRRLAVWLGPARPPDSSDGTNPTEAQRFQAWRVGAAVMRAGKALPWASRCLHQAMAAKAMLAYRGLPTTVHFGAQLTAETCAISAHAWLMQGSQTITGRAGRSGMAELARFG